MASVSVFLFALFYRIAGHIDQGPLMGGRPIDLWNCIYFSVVTFTSLGYGDIVPRGFSKVIACIEVIVGLAYLGIFIAKLSSAKQSYHLAQLYARDAQERLDDYTVALHQHRDAFKKALDELKSGERTQRSLNKIQVDAYRTVMRVRAYVSFEISNGDFLLETPIGAPARLLKKLSQLVGRMYPLSCFPDSLHSQKQRSIAARTILTIAAIGTLMKENSEDPALESESSNLLEKCEKALSAIKLRTTEVRARFEKDVSKSSS
jgi:hypothetical protein